MSLVSTNEVLNRILVLHSRSLPMYLSYAPAWQQEEATESAAVLYQIVADQKKSIDRLATFVLDNGGTVDNGEFPMSFTALHDLSVKYVINLCRERQVTVIAALEKLTEMLALAPLAQALAREVLGEAKGHLQNLQDLALCQTPAAV